MFITKGTSKFEAFGRARIKKYPGSFPSLTGLSQKKIEIL